MIGGSDILIPAIGDPAALDACVRIIGRYWPAARFEDAVTGTKYEDYEALPTGILSEVLVYRDPPSEIDWDNGMSDTGTNTMIYLILSPSYVTAVVDDPNAVEMQMILESIKSILRTEIFNTEADVVPAETA
jgi:hypothetical protein